MFSPLGIGREAIGRRGGGETFYYCFSPLRGGGGGREQDQLHMLLCLISMVFLEFSVSGNIGIAFQGLLYISRTFPFRLFNTEDLVQWTIDKLLKGG